MQLSPSQRVSNAAPVLEVIHHLEPTVRLRLDGQSHPLLWDVIMRGLRRPEESPILTQPQPYHPRSKQRNRKCKRSKTNSERGLAFRERRKKYEDDLVSLVNSLRQEVNDLYFLRSVCADNVLHSRNSMEGSLVRLTREYFALFERGMSSFAKKRPVDVLNDTENALEMKQKAFIKSSMDPELQFGQVIGPDALLDQWKKYTMYHASIHVVVVGVTVLGDEDNPIITIHSDLHVVFSRATFDHVFPHVAANEELVTKLIGREIVYHGVNRFQFSPKGQILIYNSDVGFVNSLAQAGASVSDIALMMQQAKIADECRLGAEGTSNKIQELDNYDEDKTTNDEVNTNNNIAIDDTASSENSERNTKSDKEPELSRLAIDFLLS